LTAKFGFCVSEQLCGDSSSLAGWEDGHPSQVTFVLADGLARNGADDLAGRILSNENLQADEAVTEGFRRENGIEICGWRVEISIWREGRLQAR